MSTADSPALTAGPMRADARRNRERLLATALAVFTERESDDTSLEEIARRAGVGIGTLYRHFPSRQALLEAVYRDQVEVLCARGEELLASSQPGAAALVTWLGALIDFSLTKRALTAELLDGTGKNSPVFAACRTDMLAAAQALLASAQRAGEVRPGITAADLFRLTHGLVVATEKMDKLADRAAEAGRLLTIMLEGVLEPGRS